MPLLPFGLALSASGCTGPGDQVSEGAASPEVRRSALTSTGTDSLAEYARKCDEATGIHVPAFNCDTGTEVPQSSNTDLTTTVAFLGGASGSYVPSGNPIVMELGSQSSDIQGTSDQGYFRYVTTDNQFFQNADQPGSDGKMEVKVTSFNPSTGNNSWAKAGLMFRNSAASNAPNVLLAITAGQGVTLQHRSTAGGPTTLDATTAGVVIPVFLRLNRSIAVDGTNTFTAFYSKDRATWTKVGGSVSLTGTTNPVMGIAATSHDSTKNFKATFQQLTLPTACDRPNVLARKCDPGSRFKILAQNPNATVVLNCRKREQTADGFYGDIAVIQYNKLSGAVCFYQAQSSQDGRKGTEPTKGVGAAPFVWLTPQSTWDQNNCTGCHDNGAFIRTPYLNQLVGTANVLPGSDPSNVTPGYDNASNPFRYVGRDFAADRSWSIASAQGDTSCSGCHRLATNNKSSNSGTAWVFGPVATGETVQPHKQTPYSATSPVWMPPFNNTPLAAAQTSSENYRSCAENNWTNLTHGAPTDPACVFAPLGSSAPSIAFQSNANKLWITNGHGNTNIGMAPGTSPAIASVAPGNYMAAFTATNGTLQLLDADGGSANTTGKTMSSGTSPAITALPSGIYELAFQSGGTLWLMDSNAPPRNTGVPMKAFTSPSITTLADGTYEVAFQHSGTTMYLMGSDGVPHDTGLGMAASTNPSITSMRSGGNFMATFQANTAELWLFNSTEGFGRSTGLGMAAATSPSATALPANGWIIAFQANTGELWVTGTPGTTSLGILMQTATSPVYFASPVSADLAYQAAGGTLATWTAGAPGPFAVALPMAPATNPSIANPPL